jgi:uroporphyrinogen decarboxylase
MPTVSTMKSTFVRACAGEPVPHTPVWFMRQAGRSLPEYRAVRAGVPMLESCRTPELVCEITLQPVRRHHVDAAILFSDIVVPVAAMGFGVDITPGVGPVIDQPVRTARDLERLRAFEPDVDAPYVGETVRLAVAELGGTPLIGFAGAPFTVASYLIEGRPSRTYGHTKAMMHGDETLWRALLDRLADIAIASLLTQVEAGASAIQLFDSWAGALAPDVYRDLVQPASAKVLIALEATGVPRIHFGVGTGELLALMGEAGADVVGGRLARAARRGARPRPGQGRAGQPGSSGVPGSVAGRGRPHARRPAPQRGSPRPHLQPGPRRPAADAGRECSGAD